MSGWTDRLQTDGQSLTDELNFHVVFKPQVHLQNIIFVIIYDVALELRLLESAYVSVKD